MSDAGIARGEVLAGAVRDAHGSPHLARACRAYRDALGYPDDGKLLALFLDARDAEIVAGGLTHLGVLLGEGRLVAPPELRRQLRALARDANDEVSESAADVLTQLERL